MFQLMKALFLSFVITTLFSLAALTDVTAQKHPDWTEYGKRQQQYPNAQYLVGFSSARGVAPSQAEEKIEQLLGYAKQELTESVYVTIKSIGVLNIHNVNAQTHESFRKNSVSYSKLNLSNLKTKTYYDKKNQVGYALAYAEKAKLVETHLALLQKSAAAIARKLDLAQSFHEQADVQNAMKHHFESLPAFRTFEQSYTLLVALAPGQIDQFQPLLATVNGYKTTVNEKIAAYQRGYALTLDDVAYFMAKGFDIQTKEPTQAVALQPFTYEDSGLAAAFSARWQAAFEKKLIDVAGYPITQAAHINPHYQNVTGFREYAQTEVRYAVTGTFWQEGDMLKIISVLRHAQSGEAIASMEGHLPMSYLHAQKLAVLPENYRVAQQQVEAITPTQSITNDLSLQAWTNKGNENLFFVEGETMEVSLMVNKPCYVRFIYHAADERRVLLLDNYYLNEQQVGKPFTIPQAFECTPPFGAELLQINVQSAPFEQLRTSREEGFDFIAESLDKTLLKTRGFRKKPKLLQAEKRISITTLPKSTH